MKHYALLFLVCLLLFVGIPLLALPKAEIEQPTPNLPAAAPLPSPPAEITLRLTESGETITLPAREYIFGVVAAEMPLNYHDEALKAQAVAAYTYAMRLIGNGGEGFVLSDDPDHHQAFITRAKATEKWGEKAAENTARLDKITAETEGMMLLYDSAPILAAYHDTSCGRTIPAAQLWGGDYPYLPSVESAGDMLSPHYQQKTTLTAEQFAENCKRMGINLTEDPSQWVSPPKFDKFGTVETFQICSATLSGPDARKIFSLPSAAFDVEYSAEVGFTFTTRGRGHGVGMSQTGANYMALCGNTFEEILNWYYPGAQIGKNIENVSRET